MPCAEHPSYKTGRPPKGDCTSCWALYGRRRAQDDGLRSRGRAKGGGQSSKQKGRHAVLVVAAMIARRFGLEPDDVLVKATSQGGCDIHLSPHAARLFPVGIEVKCQEKLNVWGALKQAEENAPPGRAMVLFFRRANSQTYAALRADDFLRHFSTEPYVQS